MNWSTGTYEREYARAKGREAEMRGFTCRKRGEFRVEIEICWKKKNEYEMIICTWKKKRERDDVLELWDVCNINANYEWYRRAYTKSSSSCLNSRWDAWLMGKVRFNNSPTLNYTVNIFKSMILYHNSAFTLDTFKLLFASKYISNNH